MHIKWNDPNISKVLAVKFNMSFDSPENCYILDEMLEPVMLQWLWSEVSNSEDIVQLLMV